MCFVQPPAVNKNLHYEQILTELAISHGVTLWPLRQRTRERIIMRMIKKLSIPGFSPLSRFGTLPHDEAVLAARHIEEDAYATVTTACTSDDVDGHILAIMAYSKHMAQLLVKEVMPRLECT